MTQRNTGKILLSAAVAAVTVAVSASIVTAPPASQTRHNGSAANTALPKPALSAIAFDSAPSAYGSVATTAAAQSGAAAAANPELALEIEADGQVTLRQDKTTGGTSLARVDRGGDLYPQGRNLLPADKVQAFLERHGAVFGITDAASQLRIIGMDGDQFGNSRVKYQQMHGDVPVFGAQMYGHVSADGRLTAVNGKYIPDVGLPTTPSVSSSAAADTAIATVTGQQPSARKNVELEANPGSLVVYRTNLTRGTSGQNHLAYEVEVTHGSAVREFVYVDAFDGKVVDQITGIHGLKDRRVYQSSYDPADPDGPTLQWQEGDLRPAANPTIEDQVAGAGHSYNLFFNLSGGTYRSWDGNDARMVTVNTDPTIVCPNANWNGTSTNYCEGTSSDDVIAHEWGHAYTQETSGLIYAWQSGALNESYSDIWGETVDLINNRESFSSIDTAVLGNNGPRSQDETVCSSFTNETPTGDDSIRWLMGEDAKAFSPLPPIGDAAIRDMWNPMCSGGVAFFGDAGHVDSPRYHCSTSDGGGVHSNSSINNRAFALLTDGNVVTHDDEGNPFAMPVTVQGIGITKAAHIFWRANSMYNGPATNFAENADHLVMACNDLIGQPLNVLVTSAEDGTSPVVGHMGENDDTVDPPTNEFFNGTDILDGREVGATITASDCDQVANAIEAVQMRFDVTEKCGFTPMLNPAPAPRCGSGTVVPNFAETFDGGALPAGWSTDGVSVNASTKDTANWFVSSSLPDGRTGFAAFQENVRRYGNCSTDDESGNQWLESPDIVLTDASFLLFDHYFNSEISYDGGNVKISINGGPFEVVPASAFAYNPYNGRLNSAADQNTNTIAGEPAWHGGNAGDVRGSWGESQIDLAAVGANAGDTVRLRWDFGQDGCNGSDEGWYVDRVEVFSCEGGNEPPPKQCSSYPADTLLGTVITGGVPSISSASVSGETAAIEDVNVRNLHGSHTYMGDLTFKLESPAGTEITLFDGAACGAEAGINAEFDDDAASVIGCNDWQSGDTFQPHQALSAFNGEDANGDWTMTITDGHPIDSGTLDSWSVEFCTQPDDTNTPPVAIFDEAMTNQDVAVTINVLVNDSDADGDCLRVISVSEPANGSATANTSNGCSEANPDTITYQPDPGFVGTDDFTYTIADGHGGTDTATVTVTVKPKDRDDADSDGDSDDTDSDDDNDGVRDDADSDDDGDGIADDDDSDHDNDGMHDDFDSQSTDDNMQGQSGQTSANSKDRFSVAADNATLAVVVGLRGAMTDLLSINVYDPNGTLVATSVPTPNGPLAVVPSAIAGTYSIEVHNQSNQAASYQLSYSTQQLRP